MMAIPACGILSASLRRRASAPIAVIAIALAGCSIPLESLTPSAGPREEPTQSTASANIASLSRSIRASPDDPVGYNMRGLALAQAGRTEQALDDFNRAIALRSDDAEALYNRGVLHQGERQYQSAIDDFSSAHGLVPQQVEPLLGRALSYLALGQAKEAAADLDEAVQNDPQNAQLWMNR